MWEKFETWNFISKHNETSWECHLCVQHFINLTLSSDSQLLVLRYMVQFSSVQFSLSVVSDSLQTHGLQHTSLPVHHQNPGAYSNSCLLSWWCHPTISSSVILFPSHPQSFPASGSFQMSQFSASDGQSIVVSASASVLPINIQDWFPLGWTGWISFQYKGLSRVFSKLQFKSINSLVLSFLYSPALTRRTFVGRLYSMYSCHLNKF